MATEPEHELIRRILPFGIAAIPVAFVVGYVLGGTGPAWSAAVGIVIVLANFLVNGFATARAARHSLTAVSAVVMGGFVVRLGVILAIMFALNAIDSFSPVAFAIAVIPATMALLAAEMKILSTKSAEWWDIPKESATR